MNPDFPVRIADALKDVAPSAIIPNKTRVLLLGVRQILIMAIGLLDDYLELPRTIPNARERRRMERGEV